MKKLIQKKKIILICCTIAFVVIVGAVFLTLGLTVWSNKEPQKTTAEWLNDFSESLAFDSNNANQKFEKSIRITESEVLVCDYYLLVEVHEQEQGIVGHIELIEKYPSLDTEEFDTYDEYYFINNTIYMRRESNGESVSTKFSSTWDAFWEIPSEMFGHYVFKESLFAATKIDYVDDGVSLYTEVANERKSEFFDKNTNADRITNAVIKMEIDNNSLLKKFELKYILKEKQNVSSIVTRGNADKIVIKEFVGL